MAEEKIEDTVENQITEEEKKEIETLDGKNEDELTDVEKKNKKLYARMKEAIDGRKSDKVKLEEELNKVRKELEDIKNKSNGDKNNNTEKKGVDIDPITLAKQVRALSSFDDEEITHAQILAKGMDKTVEEVVKTNDFKVWSEARKEQIKKEKGLDPDGRKISEQKKDEFFEKFSKNLPKGFEIKR